MRAALAILLAIMITAAHAADREYRDRVVDAAALSSKLNAIQALKVMLKQRRGTSQEPVLEMALAELQRDCADFEFRIAHGFMITHGAGADLRGYRAVLGDTVRLLNGFVQRYPNDPKIARAYYLRGKALLGLGLKAQASADFQMLLSRYPKSADFRLAAMAEVDLLMDLKDYAGVLRYVAYLRTTATDPQYYALLMDRQGWANYYLNDIPHALQSLTQEVRYASRLRRSDANSTNIKSACDGIALFYSTAMEHGLAGYTAINAYPYFQTIASGSDLADMLTELGYLLRTKGRDDDLETLTATATAPGTPILEQAKLDLILITFENQVNRYRYEPLKRSTAALDQWCTRNRSALGSESQLQDRARKAIAEAVTPLQREFAEYKNLPDKTPIGGALISLYTLALKLPNGVVGDEKRMKIHFDTAEISFALKDFQNAFYNYQWVVDHQTRSSDKTLVEQSSLKAISSEYEILSAQNVFPKDLKAKPLSASASPSLPAGTKFWIQSVDRYMAFSTNPDRAKGEVFQFEADRLLYSLGEIGRATERMLGQIPKYTEVKYGVASAALVLDTYVASQDWDKTYAIGKQVLSARTWDKAFLAKVRGVIGDAAFEQIDAQYKKKNYSEVVTRANDFLKQYPENPNRENCVTLAANSELALQDKSSALRYFSMLGSSKVKLQPQILLTQISLAEENRDYGAALTGLEAYLALQGDKADPDLRKKAALYAFLQSESSPVSPRLEGKGICVEDTQSYCAHLDTMAELESGKVPDHREAQRDASKALGGDPDSAIWGVMALRNPSALSLDDRDQILDQVSSRWDSEEPIAKFLLVSNIPPVVLKNLQAARQDIASSAKLRHIKKSLIDKRVRMIADVEKMSSKSMKMPWVSVRAGALRQLAGVYADFSGEIRGIPAPEGLDGQALADYQSMIGQMTGVFDKKAADLEKQASDLEAANKADLDQGSVGAIIAQFESSAQKDSGNKAQSLVKLWAQALNQAHWGKVAFLVDQMKTAGLSNENCRFAEAVSIYSTGAHPEGVAEIRSVQAELSRSLRNTVAQALQALPPARLPAGQAISEGKGGSL